MAAGKGNLERTRRGIRTIFFMLTMVAALLPFLAPLLVAIRDILVPSILVSSFTPVRCYSYIDRAFDGYWLDTNQKKMR
uniref:Uncharacterized protein n=1 Tax=Nelumbo nucifera TaxID=4432 RepID=A0A822XH47_NELNU|nr:TPA_asm: hypothetical protein HUJ06_019789 [Nelumbo nucifera]